jgi:uncharacterized protein (DUF488 family)
MGGRRGRWLARPAARVACGLSCRPEHSSLLGLYVEILIQEALVLIYTIGHSNRSLEDFLAMLREFGIESLADIRSFPGSKRFPHFGKDNLRNVLAGEGIRYVWLSGLGGRRRSSPGFDSPNRGLENPGFRAYADYMGTPEFQDSVQKLIHFASESTTTCMCAEAVYWRCHRRLLSDYLTALGLDVVHILGKSKSVRHTLTDGALVTRDRQVVYPAAR